MGVRIPGRAINIHLADLAGNARTLNGDDSVYQVLGSYRTFWFREQTQPSYTVDFNGPFHAYLLRLDCTGNASAS